MSEATDQGDERTRRGRGRGSSFFVLGREVWARLLSAKTDNRLNLVVTFLVLLAGTGSDQRLTKWSAKACEEHAGLGKPRARRAIEELIAAGLVAITEQSRPVSPQYQLPDVSSDEDPIFLPVQLVTGFNGENSVLRRVRETGDPLVLQMLIDLYGLVQLDATYGIPLSNLREGEDQEARKISEMGVHALWALPAVTVGYLRAGGPWTSAQHAPGAENGGWGPFFERLSTLRRIGALVFEVWAFEGSALDAEPMFPVDFAVLYSQGSGDPVAQLSKACVEVARAMTVDREYLLERYSNDIPIVLPIHHQAPILRGVAKLAIEPDSPGRRLAFARRMEVLAEKYGAYQRLLEDFQDGRFDRPLGAPPRDAGKSSLHAVVL